MAEPKFSSGNSSAEIETARPIIDKVAKSAESGDVLKFEVASVREKSWQVTEAVSHGEIGIYENLERLGSEVVMVVSEPEGAFEQKLRGEVMMSMRAVGGMEPVSVREYVFIEKITRLRVIALLRM